MYTLDTNGARQADQRGGVIKESGKYIGKFTRAEDIKAGSGTKGIDFSFVTNTGQKSRFALYTTKADGSKISIGHGFVMALMTCMKLREIKPQQMMVKKWDGNANAEVDAQAPCFADLMGKQIGVLLEAEEYEKNDGSIGKRMVLAGVFQADTELTASEILDKKVQPEQLAKIVATLRDRPLRPSRSASHASGSARPASGGGFDDMDDDIPF